MGPIYDGSENREMRTAVVHEAIIKAAADIIINLFFLHLIVDKSFIRTALEVRVKKADYSSRKKPDLQDFMTIKPDFKLSASKN